MHMCRKKKCMHAQLVPCELAKCATDLKVAQAVAVSYYVLFHVYSDEFQLATGAIASSPRILFSNHHLLLPSLFQILDPPHCMFIIRSEYTVEEVEGEVECIAS